MTARTRGARRCASASASRHPSRHPAGSRTIAAIACPFAVNVFSAPGVGAKANCHPNSAPTVAATFRSRAKSPARTRSGGVVMITPICTRIATGIGGGAGDGLWQQSGGDFGSTLQGAMSRNLLFAMAMQPASLFAQAGLGAIAGLATDSTGSIVPGAKVTARHTGTGVESETPASMVTTRSRTCGWAVTRCSSTSRDSRACGPCWYRLVEQRQSANRRCSRCRVALLHRRSTIRRCEPRGSGSIRQLHAAHGRNAMLG